MISGTQRLTHAAAVQTSGRRNQMISALIDALHLMEEPMTDINHLERHASLIMMSWIKMLKQLTFLKIDKTDWEIV